MEQGNVEPYYSLPMNIKEAIEDELNQYPLERKEAFLITMIHGLVQNLSYKQVELTAGRTNTEHLVVRMPGMRWVIEIIWKFFFHRQVIGEYLCVTQYKQ